MAKDPRARYDATADLARDLMTWSVHASDAGLATGETQPAETTRKSASGLQRPGALAAAGALALLAVALVTGVLLKSSARPPSPPVRLEIRLPEGYFLFDWQQPFALSPDGRLLVFSAFTWKKPFEEAEPAAALSPFPRQLRGPADSRDGGRFPARLLPGRAARGLHRRPGKDDLRVEQSPPEACARRGGGTSDDLQVRSHIRGRVDPRRIDRLRIDERAAAESARHRRHSRGGHDPEHR